MITRENYEIWMLDYAEGRLDPAQQKLFLAFLEQNPDLKNELEAFENISLDEVKEEKPVSFNLYKKQSWLLERYSADELVFHYNEGDLSAEEIREWNELVKTRPDLLQQAQKEKQLRLQPSVTETFSEKLLLKRNETIYEITPDNYPSYFIQYHETKELALYTAIKGFLSQHSEYKREFELYGKAVLKADTSIVFAEKDNLKKEEKVVALYWWRYVAAAASVVLAIWFFYPADKRQDVMASVNNNTQDSIKEKVLPKNEVSPNNITAQNQENEAVQHEQKTQESGLAHKQDNSSLKKQDRTPNQKEPQLLKEDQLPEHNLAKHQKEVPDGDRNKKDSVISPVNSFEKEELPVAVNKTGNGSNMQTVDTPKELISAVLNKKYFSEETPRQEVGNSFYAMRNVVKSVSGGQADVQKKEDGDYKEFSLKIGNFGFSRKKHKTE